MACGNVGSGGIPMSHGQCLCLANHDTFVADPPIDTAADRLARRPLKFKRLPVVNFDLFISAVVYPLPFLFCRPFPNLHPDRDCLPFQLLRFSTGIGNLKTCGKGGTCLVCDPRAFEHLPSHSMLSFSRRLKHFPAFIKTQKVLLLFCAIYLCTLPLISVSGASC